jgi:hypothetical protein
LILTPALVPQRLQRALEPWPGYYQSSRAARDWITLLEFSIAEAGAFASSGGWIFMAQKEAGSNQWSAVSRSEEEDTGKSAGATQIKKK